MGNKNDIAGWPYKMHKKLDINTLALRVLEISYKHNLSHVGSCLTCLRSIVAIFEEKEEDDIFILSNGHSGVAYYVVLEALHDDVDAEEILLKCGIHPERHAHPRISFSTGSLGMGVGAAVGFALSDRERRVYCIISDGEAAEGVVYEALNFASEKELTNLKVVVNWNGYSALSPAKKIINNLLNVYPQGLISIDYTHQVMKELGLEDYQNLSGHYRILTKEEYEDAKKILKNS